MMRTRSRSVAPPPRAFAALLGMIGLTLAIGGGYLACLGGSCYYGLAGVVLILAARLLWLGDARGAWLYAGLVVATAIWSLLEAGRDWLLLAPRLGLFLVLGCWLLLAIARRRLCWPEGRRRPPVALLAAATPVVLAMALLLAPAVPPQTVATVASPAAVEPAGTIDGSSDLQSWSNIGRDLSGNRFVPATQITAANVDKLRLAWSYRTGDMPAGPFSVEGAPLQAEGKLFVCTPRRRVIALDAETGKLLWRFVPEQDRMVSQDLPMCRGVSYHADPGPGGRCASRVFVSVPDGALWALDARTGRPCPDFGGGGVISLLDHIGPMVMRDTVNTSPGTVIGDIIVLGMQVADGKDLHVPSGVIRAYDVHSGRLVWAWDMGRPERIGAPAEGAIYTRSTPNSWTVFAADPALSLVYLPMGNPSPDFFGGYRRPYDEKYGTSLVALDTRTGRPRWSFQLVHHDLWDLDLAAQPLLVDWSTATGPRKAVVELTKMGDIFVLDRATGRPIVPVHEQPVPQAGGVPDDRRSPTQPVSALSFAPRPLREADMWGLTPIDQMLCRIMFRKTRYAGSYTLPGLTTALGYPATSGIFSWGGGTIDPIRHMLVANATYIPWTTRLNVRPRNDGGTRADTFKDYGLLQQTGTPYQYRSHVMLSVLGMPCNRPPWGELLGIDMMSGKLAWRRPFGTARDSGPLGIATHLPIEVGTPSAGGNVITGSGLSFIAATTDRYLRAYAVSSGRELWRARLPAGGNATPISYVARPGGRQFVVITAGGHGYLQTKPGDYVLAYALPGS